MSEEKTGKKRSPLRRAVIIFLSVLFALAAILAFFFIADAVTHTFARSVPSYAMDTEGLKDILAVDRESWTDEDYEFIYRQTGLTKAYFDGVSNYDEDFVLGCQRDLFYNEEVQHDAMFIGISHDYYPDKTFNMVPLKPGDVIISSSVHTFGWRNGHAALAISSTTTVQALQAGAPSAIQGVSWFKSSSNFMVLRPKTTAEEARAVAGWAKENLVNVPYSLFIGFFSPKDQSDDVQCTHCSHLVWQAYKAVLGVDIDSTGGPVVSPRNIANSDFFEVVQVNGFDLDKLWG